MRSVSPKTCSHPHQIQTLIQWCNMHSDCLDSVGDYPNLDSYVMQKDVYMYVRDMRYIINWLLISFIYISQDRCV